MVKYCKICHALLDSETGLCPNCDREKLMVLREVRRNGPKRGMNRKTTGENREPKKKQKGPRKGIPVAGIIAFIIAILAVAVILMSVFGKKTMLVGSWYGGGDTEASFTLYSDGTADISHVYGTGTWSLTNGNQLALRDFYGSTDRFTVKHIDFFKLVIGSPKGQENSGGSITFWRTKTLAQIAGDDGY